MEVQVPQGRREHTGAHPGGIIPVGVQARWGVGGSGAAAGGGGSEGGGARTCRASSRRSVELPEVQVNEYKAPLGVCELQGKASD